jgi:diguanylate cyclase (GGDEF)-like protein
MKLLCSIPVLMMGLVLAPSAAASDLITSRTVLEDRTGTLNIADVAHRAGTPMGSTLSMASSDSVYWIRLQVHAPAHGSKVVIYILPSNLNEVRLYEADASDPAGWKTRVTGNFYPFSQRDRATTSLSFVVDVAGPEATYYLRAKTRSRFAIRLQAFEPEEADGRDHQRDLLAMFFATFMLFLLLWAAHSYFLDRQRVVVLFAVFQAVYMLFGIAAMGNLAPLNPARLPALVSWINAILYLSINFTSVLFCRELFKPYEPPRLLMRWLKLLLWTYPVFLAALVLGYNTFAINGNAVLTKTIWISFAVVAFSLRKENKPSRRLLQAFFVFVLLNNSVFWVGLMSSRWISKADLGAVRILVVDGLVIGGMFAVILHLRTRQTLRLAQSSALELLLVREKFKIEQELMKQIEVQAQTDDLTGLCNRRHFLELAEHELTRAIRFKRPLTLLVIDIDEFKAINDTLGHNTGDAVLKDVSSLMRETLRDEDILGRTGGDEFTAVIVETEGTDAAELAQRLCTTVADAQAIRKETGPMRISVSVGVAELKRRNISFSGLRDEADRAMYMAKQAGRNQIFVNR